MAVRVKATRVAVNTTTGNQTISTSALGGMTPQAALFIISKAVTDDTDTSHNSYAYGITDGTNEYWNGYMHKNGVSTTITHGFACDTQGCIGLVDWDVAQYSYAQDCKASFVSFQANGVTINWDTAPSSAYKMIVVFFAGFDDVHCDDIAVPPTQNNSQATTDPGFEPDLLIGLSINDDDGFNNSGFGSPGFGIGFAVNDSPIKKCMASDFSVNAQATSDCEGEFSASYIGFASWISSAHRTEITSFDANGFTITSKNDNSSGADTVMPYLALKLPTGSNVDLWCGSITVPDSTGVYSNSEPGFQPQFALMITADQDLLDTRDWSGANNCLAVMNGDSEYSISHYSRNGRTTQESENHTSDSYTVHVRSAGAITRFEGTFDSFYSSGWKTNYTTVRGTSTFVGIGFAIGEDPRRPQFYRTYRNRRV